jgi:hypothetical protein
MTLRTSSKNSGDARAEALRRLALYVSEETGRVARAAEGRSPALDAAVRLSGIFSALADLDGPERCEAAAALTGRALELYIDIVLLSGDDNSLPLKRREFERLRAYRAAHRISSFGADAEGATPLDVSAQHARASEEGGIDAVRKRVIEVWGADNGGKPSYPVHWSGRQCTRVIAHNLGPEFEELYIRAYSMTDWLLGGALEKSERIGPSDAAAALDWCSAACSLIALEGLRLALEHAGETSRAQNVASAALKLRNNPGTLLSPEDIETHTSS